MKVQGGHITNLILGDLGQEYLMYRLLVFFNQQ